MKVNVDYSACSQRANWLLQLSPNYVQAHNKIPEDAWEYHIRKSSQDAAFTTLEYVPYCSTMPVQQSCDEPRFMWKKKERH